jgi:NTP pyrophosphatase (non-canonical NTP hydrolase)
VVDLDQIQTERNEWVARNFPNTKQPEESLLGCIEELGELSHSFLKKQQGIRGTPEEHDANARDAVGDALVYLLGVCSTGGFKLSEAIDKTSPCHASSPDRSLFISANRLGRLATDGLHFPRLAMRHVGEFYWALEDFCRHMEWSAQDCLEETWEQVKKRDWIANPQDGS